MKTALVTSILARAAATGVAGPQSRTFTGVISDSMCGRDHAAMKVSPDSKCVKASKSIHYTRLAPKNAYILGDREKPARFCGPAGEGQERAGGEDERDSGRVD